MDRQLVNDRRFSFSTSYQSSDRDQKETVPCASKRDRILDRSSRREPLIDAIRTRREISESKDAVSNSPGNQRIDCPFWIVFSIKPGIQATSDCSSAK